MYERPSIWQRFTTNKPVTAVTDITFTIPQSELFGLLGPNGAGKTTLVKMLCTLILPSSGTATVAGHTLDSASKIRTSVGLVVSDERSFYWRLSARRNLDFFATMCGLHGPTARDRIETTLAQVNLHHVADRPFSNFSSGMRQRLAIARSLLHQPRLLFLDEPTRSLDPIATQNLHNLLCQLRAEQNLTIFLVTHDLAEAEKLCDRVGFMHNGRLQTIDSPANLRQHLHSHRHYSLQIDTPDLNILRSLKQMALGVRMTNDGRLTFRATDEDGVLTAVLNQLHQHNIPVHAIEATAPSLEEVFTYFTQEPTE